MATANTTITDDQLKTLMAGMIAAIPASKAPPKERKLSPLLKDTPVAWQCWRDHFQTVCKMNKWDDEKARHEARASMQEEANLKVTGIPIEDSSGKAKPVKELLDIYESRFMSMVDSAEAEAEFQDALQTEQESTLQWHTRLRVIYRRARPKMTEPEIEKSKEIIAKFSRGLNTQAVIHIVVSAQPETYTDALDVAQRDVVGRNVSARAFGGAGAHTINAIGRGNTRGRTTPARPAGQKTESRACYTCNRVGHIQMYCPSNNNNDSNGQAMNAGLRRGGFNNRRGRGSRSGRNRGGRGAGRPSTYPRQQLRRLAAIGAAVGDPEATAVLAAFQDEDQAAQYGPHEEEEYSYNGYEPQAEMSGNDYGRE